jgi:AraC family transcriptional regulator, transcriptional activator of pobA
MDMDSKSINMVGISSTIFDIGKIRASSAIANYKPRTGVHHHDHHEILIVSKGKGTHQIDDVIYEVSDNQIFFLRPGQSHEFCPLPGSKFYFVAIDQEGVLRNTVLNLNDLAFFQIFSSNAFIKGPNLKSITDLVKAIERALKTQHEFSDSALLISSYVSVLLLEIQRVYLSLYDQSIPTYSVIVKNFNELLASDFYSRFVKDYAGKLFVSANYLNECVKNETGHTTSFWINLKTLNKAKRLLRLGTLNISEIAKHCEFGDGTHFTRFFRKHTHCAPRDWCKPDRLESLNSSDRS